MSLKESLESAAPILAGLVILAVPPIIAYAVGGVGGGFTRGGVLRGSVDAWFDKMKKEGYEPAWIVPHVRFRVVVVKPYRPTPLSIAPIVGTYEFDGVWELPITHFEEAPG